MYRSMPDYRCCYHYPSEKPSQSYLAKRNHEWALPRQQRVAAEPPPDRQLWTAQKLQYNLG